MADRGGESGNSGPGADASPQSGAAPDAPGRIPRRHGDDYTPEAAAERRAFLAAATGADLSALAVTAQDPAALPGNIEHYVGAAQIPIGVAGPLVVDGEHVDKATPVYVPLATTEGTLVASYNRGMRLLAAVGGAKTTLVERHMQRAPVFHFADARAARDFGRWVRENDPAMRAAAHSTTQFGALSHVEQYVVGPMCYLRFNFATGDAAGQNMAGKATLAACEWLQEAHPDHPRFTLSGAIDTDKKHSHINTLNGRGARVIAECTIPDDVLKAQMRVDARTVFNARLVSHTGGMLAGSANNGLHAANALAALFIATGQDAGNIAESHAGLTYVQLQDDGALYWSITLPSLIVATVGGGTGLATPRACLELMDCAGPGKVSRLIEICAATVLAGELSLASAIVGGDWVASHDRLGRNRP